MSGFYSKEELMGLGIKSVGENVLISRKASLYHCEQMTIGSNVRIEDFCVLNGKIDIGNNVMICVYSLLDGNAGITIEENVTLAARVSIHSGSDDYSGKSLFGCFAPKEKRIYRQAKPVTIRKHCILGDSATVMPGVTLNEGTAIGAKALVKKDTEAWSVYVGIPARKLKDRAKDVLKLYHD